MCVNFILHKLPHGILSHCISVLIVLNRLYNDFVFSLQWKIRRVLAYSIHEIARIIGPESTCIELLGIFEDFLKDIDEVSCVCACMCVHVSIRVHVRAHSTCVCSVCTSTVCVYGVVMVVME